MKRNEPRSLYYIVQSVRTDLGIQGTQRDVQLLKWTVDGHRDLNMAGLLQTVVTKRLIVADDYSVYIPEGFEELYKLGICCHGVIVNFEMNDSICLPDDKEKCCTQSTEEIACCIDSIGRGADNWGQEWYYLPHYHNGQFTAGVFGRGEGFHHGGYRMDFSNNKIQFDRCVHPGQEIIMEFRSSGDIETGNAYIPNLVVDALRYYVHWQKCMMSRDPIDNAKIDMFRRRYQRQVKRVVAHVNGMTLSDILSIVRSGIHQLPKR